MQRAGVMRGILAVVLVIVCAAAAFAADIAIPALTGRVVDQAGILGNSDEDSLTNKLASLEQKTSIQLVVVTLKSLQSRTIEDWGLALGRGWGIGLAGKNNGVLLIVAPSERELRIEVGYGLEGDLPDATADRIIRNVIVPRFKAGNMVGGINDGVDAIGRALAGEKLEFAPTKRQFGAWFDQRWIPLIFFGLFFLIVILAKMFRSDDDDSDGGSTWIGGSGGSWSRGSSRGGFSRGGGFRGGGGSFGGGGASGRW